jgi:hypothetical protein
VGKNKFEYWLTEDGLLLLRGWARDGLTDSDIARNCGVALSTFSEWKKRFTAISDALKEQKEVADFVVENALYKRAIGYDYIETKIDEVVGPDGKQVGAKKITKTKKHMPADVTAALAWLNNRKPQSWRRNAGKEKLDEKKFEHQKDVDDKKVW